VVFWKGQGGKKKLVARNLGRPSRGEKGGLFSYGGEEPNQRRGKGGGSHFPTLIKSTGKRAFFRKPIEVSTFRWGGGEGKKGTFAKLNRKRGGGRNKVGLTLLKFPFTKKRKRGGRIFSAQQKKRKETKTKNPNPTKKKKTQT